jgi:hypothetical protein
MIPTGHISACALVAVLWAATLGHAQQEKRQSLLAADTPAALTGESHEMEKSNSAVTLSRFLFLIAPTP